MGKCGKFALEDSDDSFFAIRGAEELLTLLQDEVDHGRIFGVFPPSAGAGKV